MSAIGTGSLRRASLSDAARAALPSLLYGLRLATGVGLALYLAFFLQLDNPGWAGTSAAIVAQPILGASLRKGIFRLLGTLIGAVATVALTAIFPQNRLGFFVGVALWCAVCSFVSTVLRNFAAYAAMLAGYTLVIIASSSIAAPDDVFMLAVSRGSEIALGIVCGMGVMAITDVGRSGQRLATSMTGIASALIAGLWDDLRNAGGNGPDSRPVRRALVARVIALEPVMDQAVGESIGASSRRGTLRAGINGLLLALSAWRTISAHLRGLPPVVATRMATALLTVLPDAPAGAAITDRDRWFDKAREVRESSAGSASGRLLLDRVGSVLEGLGRAANGAVVLGDAAAAIPQDGGLPLFMPDPLPPLVNGARVFVAVGAALLFAVATSWSFGYTFVTFLSVTVILLSPQNEQASSAVIGFGGGTVLAALLAAIVKFAVLPNHEGYGSFALIIALVLVPLAALSTRPTLGPFLAPAVINFMPLLGPTNVIDYDTQAFANSALAIVGGCVAGAIALQVMPPVPIALRAQRLLGLTLADLRKAMRRPERLTPAAWRRRVYGRLFALPPSADHADGTRLLAALTVGLQMMTLRSAAADRRVAWATVEATAQAIARGAVGEAIAALASLPTDAAKPPTAEWLRIEGAAREVAETLAVHADYFGAAIR